MEYLTEFNSKGREQIFVAKHDIKRSLVLVVLSI